MLTPDQISRRRLGIGGSDIGAIAGLCPYRGPHDVRLDKRGESTFDGNVHTERGTFLEPAVIAWAEHRWGWKVREAGTLVHPEHAIVLATPDGVVTGEGVEGEHLLEVKCPSGPSARLWGPPETDQIPDDYWAQVIWGMGVTGLRHAFVVALLNGDLVRYHVEWSQRMFDALVGVAKTFWARYVEGDEVPDMDGTQGADAYLAKMFPHANEEVLESTAESDQLVRMYLLAADGAKESDRLKREMAQRLKAHLGAASRLDSELAHVSYRENKNGDRRLSVLPKGAK